METTKILELFKNIEYHIEKINEEAEKSKLKTNIVIDENNLVITITHTPITK